MKEKLIRSLKEKIYKNIALLNVFVPSVYVGNNTVLTRTIYGQKLFVNTQDLSLAPHLLLNRYWEKGVSDFFVKLIKPGMRVVEVGGNVGYYSVLAASKIGANGYIHTFEANPTMHKLLQKNMDINGFLPISKCINKAVSDRIDTVKFKILSEHLGGSYLCEGLSLPRTAKMPPAGGDIASSSKGGACTPRQASTRETADVAAEIIEVESTCLDLELGEDYPIDVLKIDAEGAEPLILKGAINLLKNNHNIKIILEFCINNFPNSDAEEYLNFLRNLGFKLYLIGSNSKYKPVSNAEIINNNQTQELFLSR